MTRFFALLMIVATASAMALAQASPAPAAPPASLRGLAPTYANILYAPENPATSKGHLLDLYLPKGVRGPLPVVIWTSGSAWFADNGKWQAGVLAAHLLPAGYAVAGVSIRSSSQVKFPGQLYDIKAAIRWLRAHAAQYRLDPARIAIMGDSSGGWTAAMAAVTGGDPGLEGAEGVTGVSSRVQAAIAFYPPTSFLTMDAWALRRCDPNAHFGFGPGHGMSFCHDAAWSPESQLLGCPIQSCPAKARAASPMTYISPATPPIMIVHGDSDQLVPHNQGASLYMALNKACRDAVFISLPTGQHGQWIQFLSNPEVQQDATIRSTSASGCRVRNPEPYTPSWQTVTGFLNQYLLPHMAQ